MGPGNGFHFSIFPKEIFFSYFIVTIISFIINNLCVWRCTLRGNTHIGVSGEVQFCDRVHSKFSIEKRKIFFEKSKRSSATLTTANPVEKTHVLLLIKFVNKYMRSALSIEKSNELLLAIATYLVENKKNGYVEKGFGKFEYGGKRLRGRYLGWHDKSTDCWISLIADVYKTTNIHLVLDFNTDDITDPGYRVYSLSEQQVKILQADTIKELIA